MKEKAITVPMNSATPLLINAARRPGRNPDPRHILAGVNSKRTWAARQPAHTRNPHPIFGKGRNLPVRRKETNVFNRMDDKY